MLPHVPSAIDLSAFDPSTFDPNGVGSKTANLFGLPVTCEQAKVVIIPVPWEVTVSYGAGTAQGPEAVLAASSQLDLFDPDAPNAWKVGLAMQPIDPAWQTRNRLLREQAAAYIRQLEHGDGSTHANDGDGSTHANGGAGSTHANGGAGSTHANGGDGLTHANDGAGSTHANGGDGLTHANAEVAATVAAVNQASLDLNAWVKAEALQLLAQNKLVGVLGGDHSVPLGLMQALAEQYPQYSILHVDAHADLRVAYEGFEFSHASIMHNALKLPQIQRLVQVSIRDLCHAEVETIAQSQQRIVSFYDWDLKERQFQGQSWHQTCEAILSHLSDRVYVSFDIDGLEPALCPDTGTPVVGGLRFEEAYYLLRRLAASGKTIIGFDLCEVSPGTNEWNGNVGARILYKLITSMVRSQPL